MRPWDLRDEDEEDEEYAPAVVLDAAALAALSADAEDERQSRVDAAAAASRNTTVYRDRDGRVIEARSAAEAASVAEALRIAARGGQNRSAVPARPTSLPTDDPLYIIQSRTETVRDLEKRRASQAKQGPPNRYDILPGPRWDGVNRSNGFESNLLGSLKL